MLHAAVGTQTRVPRRLFGGAVTGFHKDMSILEAGAVMHQVDPERMVAELNRLAHAGVESL